MDRMAQYGAYFKKAYSQSPVCGPARGSLRTGCTIERSGLQANGSELPENYERMKVFKRKVEVTVSLDQILAENGYTVEYYGKWHLPDSYHYHRKDVERSQNQNNNSNKNQNFNQNNRKAAIKCNDYDYDTGKFKLSIDAGWVGKLRRYLAHDAKKGNIKKNFKFGDQEDTYTKYPYTPIRLDARYGLPTDTSLTDSGYAVLEGRSSQPNILGRFSLDKRYTPIGYNGDVATRALKRLAQEDEPFALTISFHNPHAPMTPAKEFLNNYWDDRHNMFVSPSISDDMKNSAYNNAKYKEMGYQDVKKVKEWTALYYAMIEEIDDHIGNLFDKLEKYNVHHNTLVVFTSDHGEMLGAHGMREKNNFYEESVRVPLFLFYPNKIIPGTRIDDPVSHLDLYATILDYLNIPKAQDNSDGTSLRRFIESSSYNENYDETAVVSEWDFRVPVSDDRLDRALGAETNFMLVKGHYKLMMTKLAKASRLDMLYNLQDDPYETNNLLGNNNNNNLDATTIGKAEHLKCLLLEWMKRMDGPGYYSGDSKWSDSTRGPFTDGVQAGDGDKREIRNRQRWSTTDLWVSDSGPDHPLEFGSMVWTGDAFRRNEYYYFGRTSRGTLRVDGVVIRGADASHFRIEPAPSSVDQGDYVRLKVSYDSAVRLDPDQVDAYIQLVHSNRRGVVKTKIVLSSNRTSTFAPTMTSTQTPTASPNEQFGMFGQLFNLFLTVLLDLIQSFK